MTLREMSIGYRANERAIRLRIADLQAEEGQVNRQERRALRQRIAVLSPLLQEMRELADLTEHYYDGEARSHVRYHI